MSDFSKITFTLTGDTHNLKVPEAWVAEYIRLDPGGSTKNLTGIVAPPNGSGRLLFVHNIAGEAVVFQAENASSAAENRFAQGFLLSATDLTMIFYVSAAKRWFPVSAPSL